MGDTGMSAGECAAATAQAIALRALLLKAAGLPPDNKGGV